MVQRSNIQIFRSDIQIFRLTMGQDLSIHVLFYTLTHRLLVANHGDLFACFPRITLTRDCQIQTLLEVCHHWYIIQYAPPLYLMRRIMSYNGTTALENSTFLSRDIIAFVFIVIVILLFMKIGKEKEDKINELHKGLCRRSVS